MTLKTFKGITISLAALCIGLCAYMLFHSLSGAGLVGCGTGSGCDSVMSSPWAYILGTVPVSALALSTYLLVLVCLLFLSRDPHDSLQSIVWLILTLLSGSIIGAALWFSYLQIAVLHAFCRYCTLTHALGSLLAIILLCKAPLKALAKVSSLALGLLAAAAFAFVQAKTLPKIIYDEGASVTADLPSFSSSEVPSIGPETATQKITLLFDFQCIHCRKLHAILPRVVELSGGRLQFLLCPVPLSSECNPYIPSGIDRFAGSCTLTKLALAVWYGYPSLYPEAEQWLLGGSDPHQSIKAEEAFGYVSGLVGEDGLREALGDPRIAQYLSKVYQLFGRTSNSSKSGIPRLIFPDGRWIVPETDSPEELLKLIEND